MCEIRFASTSVSCRNPYPVCKKSYSLTAVPSEDSNQHAPLHSLISLCCLHEDTSESSLGSLDSQGCKVTLHPWLSKLPSEDSDQTVTMLQPIFSFIP